MALDVQTMTQQRKHPLKGYKPASGSQVLDELRAAKALVAAKATQEESAAFGAWLQRAPKRPPRQRRTAVMGFHAKRVSDGEQAMLDQVRQAVGD